MMSGCSISPDRSVPRSSIQILWFLMPGRVNTSPLISPLNRSKRFQSSFHEEEVSFMKWNVPLVFLVLLNVAAASEADWQRAIDAGDKARTEGKWDKAEDQYYKAMHLAEEFPENDQRRQQSMNLLA